MSVDLVYDRDCPHVAAARTQLLKAFAAAAVPACWREWDASAPTTPPQVRGYGSPTILVDGSDVAGATPDAGAACRIYRAGDGAVAGVPPVATIVEALVAGRVSGDGRLHSLGAALPGLGVALLPKIACPACWPAYAGLLSALGLGFLLDERWLLPLSVLALVLMIAALAWQAPRRNGYGPAVAATVAAAILLLAKFVFDAPAWIHGAIGALIVASIWNLAPRRAASPACSTPAAFSGCACPITPKKE